ncbi:hypothetical protein [Campylobacter hyointestinalis]|uniref:hypothetical protein n=1 Tax=Campylobacter hyointestinalis TaxID=198 RepID=UPI000DCB906E|nr:hypothetical protein [Campylobacter hyointestinalis]RAZ46366.1 hypothetical protein CHL14416_05900 [Campylobacter hyointestinalis subsp. lawsonii]RAZ61276.1 hypothetical protein CHL10071_02420 [Campylobacter hyointestinalis subsp. lawsonii]
MKFKNNHADRFLDELWERINKFGLLNASKNDIGDYIIYLLNKHCVYNDKDERFFDKLPHSQIEKILKINSARIKNAQNNIKIKYANDIDENSLFDDFINDLLKDKIKLRKAGDEKIKFVIENKAKRSIIEAKLKELCADTLDSSFNSEIVTIDIKNFLKMLKAQKNFPKEIESKVKKCDDNIIIKALKSTTLGNIISFSALVLGA